MKSVLILASGGLDSTVLIALYKSLGYNVHLLYLPYGNLNEKSEVRSLCNAISNYEIPKENTYTIPLDLSYSNSSCVHEDGEMLYVEMRNLIFISYAISMAEAKGIDEVAVGFIKVQEDYKDTSEEFVTTLNNLSVSTTGIEVKAPLKQLNKDGVYRLGKLLGVKLKDTFSCNMGGVLPCGECLDCLDTKKLIKTFDMPNDDNPFITK